MIESGQIVRIFLRAMHACKFNMLTHLSAILGQLLQLISIVISFAKKWKIIRLSSVFQLFI